MKRAAIGALLFSLFVLGSCVLADTEDRISDVVKHEIVRRNPAYKDGRIEIEYRIPEMALKQMQEKKGRVYKLDYSENLRLAGNVVLPIEVFDGKKRAGKLNIQAGIRIYKKILEAAVKMKKGHEIVPFDLKPAERDVTVLPRTVIFDQDAIVGKESVTFIPAGTVILDWMARQKPDIHKGEELTVFSGDREVMVSSKAIALEDGYSGKILKMQNKDSKKSVTGVLLNSREAEAR